MKKTQVALAALALVASTAALANGVTVYGNLDAGIANTSVKQTATVAGQGPSGTAAVGSYFSGAGAFTAGNYLGFRGSEDLGNGLKANFNLEAGLDTGNGFAANGGTGTNYDASTGAGGSVLFTRQANVGLGGDFGSLTAGLQLSPFIASVAGTGTLGNGHFFVNRLLSIGGSAAFAGNAGTAAPGSGSGGFFVPNSVSYSTPSMMGWTASAMTSTKTGTTGGGALGNPLDTNSYQAYSLTGTIGALNTSLAYHSRSDTYTASAISANTKLGDVTFAGSYMSAKYDAAAAAVGAMAGVRVGSWNIGAGYPFTEAFSGTLQYAQNDILGGKQALTGVGLQYTLSKRTFLYGSYTQATNGASSSYDQRVNITNAVYAGTTAAESNHTIAVGVAHSF